MKKMWKIAATFGIAIVVCTLGACITHQDISNSDSEKIILRYGEVNPEGHFITNTAHYFADKVNELSDGHIEVEVYPYGQLGDETQYYQTLQMGGLDLFRGNISSIS